MKHKRRGKNGPRSDFQIWTREAEPINVPILMQVNRGFDDAPQIRLLGQACHDQIVGMGEYA
jgi:hypothetical protein